MNLTKINEDARGSIHSITGNMKTPEISIMKTLGPYARGGCIHRQSKEWLCVIEGHITYHLERNGIQEIRCMGPGSTICIEPNIPHYIVSDTDSIIIEWGPKPEEKIEKHEEMRRMVLEHNSHI